MLDNLHINATQDTPEIILNKEENIFEFSGNSLPDNSIKFYAPVIAWIAEYVIHPNEETLLKFKMDYFNSSTARVFIEIFHELKEIDTTKQVKIQWYYQKDDLLIEEKGLELQSIADIAFELIEMDN